jgi:ribosomal protein S30
VRSQTPKLPAKPKKPTTPRLRNLRNFEKRFILNRRPGQNY